MSIIIGADFVPTDSNIKMFRNGDTEELFGKELCELLAGADFRIFNLEIPLTDTLSPISKCGPNLQASTDAIAAYKSAKVDLLTIANNHMLDQGAQGYRSTAKALKDVGIDSVGGGENITEASKPYFFTAFGKKIGVYACVEHEFSIAGTDTPGANPFDPLYSLDHVEELKEKADFVIVLYHGGKEHYRYPSPDLQKVCRRLVDKGADLVLCQHSHCIGCEEKYKDGTIVYGQGNFLFDHSTDECWKTGLLVSLDEKLEISYIPIVKSGEKVRLADEDQMKSILFDFRKRSEEIQTPGFVSKRYSDFAKEMSTAIFSSFSANDSLIFRVLNKLTGNFLRTRRNKRRFSESKRLEMRNRIECEAWRELSLAVMEKGYDSK